MIDTDFFVKKTKKQQVLEFIKMKKEARTSDVIKFGSSIFHNRAERDARDLADEGLIKRMNEDEKNFRYSYTKEDVWVFVKDKC